MLIEVAILQRFVLLLGHPVYSLTVTLFSLLLGTGIGAALSRRLGGTRAGTVDRPEPRGHRRAGMRGHGRRHAAHRRGPSRSTVRHASPWRWRRSCRSGCSSGIPMPAGIQMLSARAPQMVTWAWGMNGALSVVGATLAIFIAMNWGFRVTFLAASVTYLVALAALLAATRSARMRVRRSLSTATAPSQAPRRQACWHA